ncbi:hypothetical protein [Rhodanobacter lindaniclasticus]
MTNGILQARLDFDPASSKMSLARRRSPTAMADMARRPGWIERQLAEGMALKEAVASTDAVSAIEHGRNQSAATTGYRGSAAAMPVVRVKLQSGWSATSPARATTCSSGLRRHRHLVD